MAESTKEQISKADSLLANRQYRAAGKCLEQAAQQLTDGTRRLEILTLAGQAYQKAHSRTDALRCYTQASPLATRQSKADLLVAIWTLHIDEIAGCLYNCGFEWRGDMDGAHDSEHDFYRREVREHGSEAEKALIEALSIKGIGKSAVLKAAARVCENRELDGWGADICWKILRKVRRRRMWGWLVRPRE